MGYFTAMALVSFPALADEASLKEVAPLDGGLKPALSLKFGSPSLLNCPGVCSAKTGGEIGINWMDPRWFSSADTTVEVHTSFGIKYASYPVVINGSSMQFDSQAVDIGMQFRHKAIPDWALAIRWDVFGMARTSEGNKPPMLNFTSTMETEILYNITPTFQLSLGAASRGVPASSSDIWMNSVSVGFNWMPK